MSQMLDNIHSLRVTMKISMFMRHPKGWSEHKVKSEYTIWSIYEGQIEISTGGKTYYVNPGDVVIFYPGQDYVAQSKDADCAFVFNQYALEAGKCIDLMESMEMSGIIRASDLGNIGLKYCKEYRKYVGEYQHYDFEAYAGFIHYLSQLFQVSRECVETFPMEQKEKENSLISEILRYMGKCCTRDVSVGDLARKYDLSEKYFITYFKQCTGFTPKQFMIMLRMQKATELLLNTDLKLADIAEQLGYADQYCFSKAFESFYGMFPREFRAM